MNNRDKELVDEGYQEYLFMSDIDQELRQDAEVDRAFYCYSEELRIGPTYICKCGGI